VERGHCLWKPSKKLDVERPPLHEEASRRVDVERDVEAGRGVDVEHMWKTVGEST
jgi:hypothetical protein